MLSQRFLVMSDEQATDDENPEIEQSEPIDFREFLEKHPPSSDVIVKNLFKTSLVRDEYRHELSTPELLLFCLSDICGGQRIFRFHSGERIIDSKTKITQTYIRYLCSNCRRQLKIFALNVDITDYDNCRVYKFGELPLYGSPTPPRLLNLFDHERDMYLKGRRCEFQGLGIGAFVY
jgi:hypothetical protein